MPKISEIEFTPNPNAKRFVLKEPLTWGITRSFDTAELAKGDALGEALFAIPHVVNVYYVDRWITITQDGKAKWAELERLLAAPIRSAPSADERSLEAPAVAAVPTDLSPADQARLAAINALLDERVRPALNMDGGGLEVLGLEGDRLKIHYQGACGSCPSSLSGTLMGIEGLLQTIEPRIEVVAV
jgi:Fe-S cluster biogenesis protein NfuA